MTKEARQELRELWAKRVEAFLASGLSQRAWCREHGLKQERLSYWLRKFRAEASAKHNGRWLQLLIHSRHLDPGYPSALVV